MVVPWSEVSRLALAHEPTSCETKRASLPACTTPPEKVTIV